MDAIKEEADYMEVDPDRCIGCGLCVPTCADEAISMVEKVDTADPPDNMLTLMMQIAKERGVM